MKKHYKALPNNVLIGQRNWRVVVSNEKEHPELSEAWAYYDGAHDEIIVRDNMTAGRLRIALIHEILHAIRYCTMNEAGAIELQGEEEDVTDFMMRMEHYYIFTWAEPLLIVMRNNPKLLKFLLSKAD